MIYDRNQSLYRLFIGRAEKTNVLNFYPWELSSAYFELFKLCFFVVQNDMDIMKHMKNGRECST